MAIHVYGIFIDEIPRLFLLRSDNSSTEFAKGLEQIKGYLEKINTKNSEVETSVFFVCKESFKDKEGMLKVLLRLIPPQRTKWPPVVYTTKATPKFSNDIKTQVTKSYVEQNKDTFQELQDIAYIRAGYIPVDVVQMSEKKSPTISMMVFGVFIAALGIAAVAVALTVLNAATLGVAGLVVAGIGVTATLAGVGLFAFGAIRKSKDVVDESLQDNLVFDQ